jgi:hypothetical protein
MAEAVAVKTPLVFSPSTVIALIATTMIRATITAYSTAVGPSSLLKNLTNFSCKVRMRNSFRIWKLRENKVNHK